MFNRIAKWVLKNPQVVAIIIEFALAISDKKLDKAEIEQLKRNFARLVEEKLS